MGSTGVILADFARNTLDELCPFWIPSFHAESYSFAYSFADACHEKSWAIPFN
jgi:hypothetical protein